MPFFIHQHSTDIEVFLDDKAYLYVRQKYNWWGILHNDFIMDGKSILKTTYDNSFFRIRMSILDQDLPQQVQLEKVDGKYVLNLDGHAIIKTRRYFKNPIRELFLDGRLAAQVETDLKLVIGGPVIYRMTILDESSTDLFLLLFFLLDLSPSLAQGAF